jgi:tRNA (guanine-N7-)-methyltransferase
MTNNANIDNAENTDIVEGPDEDTLRRNVHGRRLGRPLSTARQVAMDALLPTLSISEEDLKGEATLDPKTLFKHPEAPVWLEIGFGSGEHLHHVMASEPKTNFIGAEPYINGMSAFLKDLHESKQDTDHIKVHMDDALMLVDTIKDHSLDGIYILNPDPWHKYRHHKRRIVRQETLDKYARILKSGSKLVMTSDVEVLSEWMTMQATMHPAFTWVAKSPADWKDLPQGWQSTRYENKGRAAGRFQSYLIFERK